MGLGVFAHFEMLGVRCSPASTNQPIRFALKDKQIYGVRHTVWVKELKA